ncbi:WhiB family transcriptional regulator [Streptomyces sp. NPDC005134]
MNGLIIGTRTGHLTERPAIRGELGFELAPDPGLKGGLCKSIEPEVFFPERGDRRTASLARELCALCPVQAACLADALQSEGGAGHGNRFGIRGGKSPEERYEIFRQTADTATAVPDPVPAPVKAKREPIGCGTRRGYHKHRRNGEKACDACRYANTAADRRLRATGTTKEVSA